MNQPRITCRPVTQRRHFALHPLSLALMLGFTGTAGALPNAGTVVSGQVTIQNPSANLQVITQASQRGIIDWKSFSIGSGQTVRFNQVSSSAVLLNRVTGYDPSQILGQMQANGRIFLLNPHGIVFGASARVDVGGMVASTLSLSNADFNAGRYQLTSGGGRGALRNDGLITADGGTVALVAPKVTNTGTIEADGGRVGLAAADSVLVDVEGDGMVFFNASATGMKNRLEHLGRIQADGGTVEMRAAARGAMADTVLNMDGVVRARSIGVREGQVVIDGGESGVTALRGQVDARGATADSAGGDVTVTGRYVLLDDTAAIHAGGASGGDVRVGGGFHGVGLEHNAYRVHVAKGASIDVSATGRGDSGTAVVWADDFTRFQGRISARGGAEGGDGGLVEVSGKRSLDFAGTVDTRAVRGRIGTLLLDPTDITISSAADSEATPFTNAADDTFNNGGGASATLNVATLTTQLGTTAVIVDTTSGGPGTGNITVDAAISWSNANKLTLRADGGIDVNQTIANTGGAALELFANGAVTLDAAVSLRGGAFTVAGKAGGLADRAASFTASPGATITTSALTGGADGGAVTIRTTGVISTRNITTEGGVGAAGGGNGGAGGNIRLDSSTGSVTVTGAIGTTGGAAGTASATNNTDGGTGGKGGDVDILSAGTLTLGAIATTGGVGGAGSDTNNPGDGGIGGAGGAVTLTASGAGGNVAAGGTITATGGLGGVGGDDANGTDNGDGGTGGAGAVVQITSNQSGVGVAAISTVGGAGGAGVNGGANGDLGAGANITLAAQTDLTLGGALTASTQGTTVISLTFGADAGANTLSLGSGTLSAARATYTGGAGVDTIARTLSSGDTITGGSDRLTGTNLPGATVDNVTNVDRLAIATAATGSNTVTLTDWAGTSGAAVQLGGATGSIAGTSNASLTTITGTGGQTFTIDAANGGSISAGPTFTSVGNLVSGGAGGGAFNLTTNTASILSVDGGTAGAALSLAGKTGTVVIDLEAGDATDVTSFTNISSLVGNGTDTRLIGRDIATTYNVSGTNTGSIVNADGTITFSGVTRLVGGTNADLFEFGNGALLRSIDGGTGTDTLSYATRGGAVTVNLQATDLSTGFVAAAAGFTGIETLVGNQGGGGGAATSLVGPNAGATFTVNASNAGTVGTLAFSGVGSLTGGTGADSFVFTGTGALAGSLTDTGGTTTLSGTIATGTTQSYAGAVTLGSPAVTVSSSGTGVNGAITFSGAVDATTSGVESLTVNTQGTTTFSANVGTTQRLASITTDAGGTTVLPAIVRTTGNQNFADGATGATVTLDASGPATVTLGVGSDIDTLNLTVTGAATVLVNDADALAVGTFNIGGGTARFVVQDSIVRTTPLTLGGAALTMNVGGGVDVDGTVAGVFGSALANYTEVEVSAGTTAAQDNLRIAGTGALEALVVSGNLVVDATGPILQTGTLNVTGTSSFTALNQSVDLRNAGNNFVGEVSVDVGAGSAGAVQIWDNSSLVLGDLTLGTGFVQLAAGVSGAGSLTQALGTSVTQAPGAANVELYAFGGSVALTNTTNDFTGAVLPFAQGASAGVRDLNNLVVDFSIFPNGPNTGITAIAGGTLTLQNAPVNFSTGAGDINLQSLGGALTLAPATTLSTTTGNITLASAGNLTVQAVTTNTGDLSFTAVGGNVILAQNITTGGDFTFNTTGNFAGGGFSLDVGGAVTGSAGGSIDLNGNFGGLGPLTAGTSIQVFDNEGGLFPATGLTLNGNLSANGGSLYVFSAGQLVLGNRTVTATNGARLDGQGGVSSTGGSVDAGAGTAIVFGYSNAVTLGSRTVAGEGATLVGGGGVTGSGAIDAGAGVVVASGQGTGQLALTGAITTTNTTATAVRLIDATSLQLGPITTGAGGAVVLGETGVTVGNISQTGIITTGTLTGVSTGDVTLSNGNQLQQLGPFSASGALTIADAGGLALTGNVQAGTGRLTLTSTGALNLGANAVSGTGATLQGLGITSTGGSVFGGTGTVLVDGLDGAISLAGSVQTANNTASALVIRNATNVTLNGGASTGAAGTLTLGVGADITGNVTLGGTAALSTGTLVVNTGGSVTLESTNLASNVATVGAVTTNGAFRLDDNVGGLAITGAVNTNGGLVDIQSVGAVTMPGSINANGVTLAGTSVTLNGGNLAGGAGTVQLTATGGDVSQTAGTISTTGALQVSATGSGTFANAVTIGSLGTSTVGGTLDLDHSSNLTVAGVVNAATLDLTAVGAIALNAAVTTTGTTTLAAGTNISQTAALSTATLVATGPNGVVLTNPSNRIGTVSGSSSGGAFSIFDNDLGLALGGSVSGTSVSLTTVGALALGANTVNASAGDVVLNGVGVTGSAAVTAGGTGNINVDAGGGTLSLTGGLTAAGDDVVLLDGGATTIGNVTAATVELGRTGVGNTLGSVAQTGGSSVSATLLSGAVTGAATLGNTNAVTNLGPFTAGSLVFGDAGGLTVVGNITTTSALGALQITTTGALDLGALTVQSAGTLALSGTSLTQTTAGDVIAAGNATLNGGAGGIDLTSDTNSFGGIVTLQRTGGAVDLHAAGNLFVGSLDAVANQPVTLVAANDLTLATGGLLDIGSANLTLEATAGNLQISGDIIANVLDITAGGTIGLGGNITTTGDQTYAGAVSLTGPVTMDSGASKIALQGGATGSGDSLTLVSTNTDADAISTGAGIDSIGAFTVQGNITLGGDVSGNGAQSYQGAVVLNAPTVTISAGAGNVTFASTVDGTTSGAQSLVVTTSGVTRFDDVVGTGVALNNLTTNGGGSTVLAGAGSSGTAFVTTIGDQLYDEAIAIQSDTLLRANRVTFSGLFNANSFEIAFQVAQETVFGGGVTGGGRIVLTALDPGDSIGLTGAAGDLQISQATLDNLAGFGTVVIGAVDFSGDVQSNNVVLPTNLEVRTSAGTVDFNGTVLSDGTPRNLTVNAGGLTTFGAAIGNAGGGALGTITVSGDLAIGTASVRSTDAQTYGGDVAVTTATTLAGSAIDIAGTLTAGANNVTLLADAIGVNAVASAGTVRLGGSTAGTAIGIATADIAGRLDLSQVQINAFGSAADLIIGRADGTAAISGNAFTLSTDTRIESTSGNVTLSGAINSASGSNHDLEIATGGLTTLGGAVGGAAGSTQALGVLTIEGESRLNGGTVRTVGAQTYQGAATLGAATTLTGPTVAFGSTVDGAFALTVNADTTSFGDAVGAGTRLASLTTNAAGTTTLGGNVSTTGAQTYNDAVVLGANATLAASRVTLASTVNGARALQIDAAGGVTLGGAVGNTTSLSSLEVNGPTTIGATEISTTGAQRYAGSVTLTAGATTLVGSALTFTSTVNGANELVLQSSGTTTFGGNVGGSTALASIDSQGDGGIVLLGELIRTTGAQSYAGALQVSGNTTLQGGTLLFASGLSGAANLTLRTDALAAQAPITGTGLLTIAPLSQGTTIGLAGAAGDLQITQAILNGADDFSRLVIGRADGTGAINAGNLRLFDDTRILSRTGDIRLNGRVNGAVNLQLDTGGTTRIAGPIGSDTALLSLTTDNNPNVADWDGTTGERTLFDAGGGRAVVTTEGDQTYNDPVVTTVPVTLSAANVVAAQTGNRFGAALNLNAQTVTLRSGESIDLGDVTITNGGTVETGGVLRLSGALRLEGGTLVLSSLAAPTALDTFTDAELAEKAKGGLVVNGRPVVEASATIDQNATESTVSTAAGTLLVLRSREGGSINLLGDNALLGEVSAVSGSLGDTDATRFQGAGAVTIGFVRLNSTQINVAGAPPAGDDQTVLRAGIESDAVWLRADRLFTGPDGLIRARLPFNNFTDGSDRSVPGLTLFMSEVALAEGNGFGGLAPDTWIQVSIGDAAGGFLTVRPKGENGKNALIRLAGEVDARPFYDGNGRITEVRVFYNGDAPRTAQEQGALSAVQALAEDARQSRFEEAVRTENVRQRLRSGVIAEVGAGRPATVGRESIKLPDNCEPKAKSLDCQ